MKRAYVTLLCNGDGYVTGAEVLGKSLQASGTQVPRLAMVTADISREARARLLAQHWELREVEPIANPHPDGTLVFSRFASVFTKLRAWDLADVDRAVLLDADTLVLRNIDDLFDRSHFAAAPDFFLPDRFNSGVLVLEPSRDVFAKMVTMLSTASSYDGGDQGFLNSFFADWYAMPAANRLPAGYNLPNFIHQFAHAHPSLRDTLAREARVLHYMVQKPWQAVSTLTGGSAAWWKTYSDAHPDHAQTWRRRVHELEDWTFDKLAAWALD
jgi:glycogenin glucosyltransferase